MLVLNALFPVMALTLLGYFLVRGKLMSVTDSHFLTRLTFNIFIPALLFINTARTDLNLDTGLRFLIGYYCVVIAVYVCSLAIGRLLFGFNAIEQSVFAMGATYPNTTIVGIPIVAQALGEEALIPLFLIISIQNILLFAMGIIAAERNNTSSRSLLQSLRELLRQLLTSPITASLLAGLTFNFAHIAIPAPVARVLDLLASAAIPAALITLGASLHEYRINHQLPQAIAISIIKLVLMPIAVWVMLAIVLKFDTRWSSVALVASAMPVGISAYIFSNRYDTGQPMIAAGTVVSTTFSVITLLGFLAFAVWVVK